MELNLGNIIEKAKLENIAAQLRNLDNDKLMSLNNEYCEHHGYTDSYIWRNNESFFEENYSGASIMKIVNDVTSSDYNVNQDYVKLTIYGPESSDSVENLLCDTIEKLAEYCYEYDAEQYYDTDDAEYDAIEAIEQALLEYYKDKIDTDDLRAYAEYAYCYCENIEDVLESYIKDNDKYVY